MPETLPPPTRVLVVDDDLTVLQMLGRVLTEEGYAVHGANSGREAIEALRFGRYDVMLLDLGMPRDNGWTTLKKIRQEGWELPVVIITAWPHQHAAAREAGAVACLEKPLDFPELLAVVKRAATTPLPR